jgi:hypothetical protein
MGSSVDLVLRASNNFGDDVTRSDLEDLGPDQ